MTDITHNPLKWNINITKPHSKSSIIVTLLLLAVWTARTEQWRVCPANGSPQPTSSPHDSLSETCCTAFCTLGPNSPTWNSEQLLHKLRQEKYLDAQRTEKRTKEYVCHCTSKTLRLLYDQNIQHSIANQYWLIFKSQLFIWRLQSSETWHSATGRAFANVLKAHSTFILEVNQSKKKATGSLEPSRTTRPMTQRHASHKWNLKQHLCRIPKSHDHAYQFHTPWMWR
jgi:hypothetical protein